VHVRTERLAIVAALVVLVAGLLTAASASAVTTCLPGDQALQHMHSHNDYDHPTESAPILCSALSYGATSVEADVWLIDGKLYVNHAPPKDAASTKGTLLDDYLKPLEQLFKAHLLGGGWIYPSWSRPLTLVVEIKNCTQVSADPPVIDANCLAGQHPPQQVSAQAAIAELGYELLPYEQEGMLSTASGGHVTERPVTVLLTGNADASDIIQSPAQDTFVNLTDDTFLDDVRLNKLPPLSVAPLVNVQWCHVDAYLQHHVANYAKTCAAADEPDAWKNSLDVLNLQSYSEVAAYLATMAHAHGLKIRWWGVPDETENNGIWTTDPGHLDDEILNGLDYVSANSTDDSSAPPNFGDVAAELIRLGDGCSGVQECALGVEASVAIQPNGGQLSVTGTLRAIDSGECAYATLTFFRPDHTAAANETVNIPAVCSTAKRPWGVTVSKPVGSYAAVGIDVWSTQTYHNGRQTTHDFYYL
jgi:hypothetical protein